MAQRTPNYTLVLTILIMSAAVTLWAKSRPGIAILPANVESMPAAVGNWQKTGEDQEAGKDVLEGWIVAKENFLSRTYENDENERVTLMLVYKGLDRRGWHVSEMCFSGSGYNVVQSVTQIPYGGREQSAVKLYAESHSYDPTVISVYWFAMGAHAEHNFWRQQGSMALARLNPPKEGWAFIRVTSEVNVSEEHTMKLIRDFIKAASDDLVKSIASQESVQ